MKLTPLDITQQTFPGRVGGYDKEAVQQFLNAVGSSVEELLREQQSLSQQVAALSRELEEKRAQEEEIRRVIVAAERIAHDMKENAVRESELMLAQARTQVQEWQQEQQLRTAQLETEQQARLRHLEQAFMGRYADLEREQHELTLERERQHAERVGVLDSHFNDRYLDLQTRLSAARQEYTQFLNGYRALVQSFAELSQRHALPDDAPLPRPRPEKAQAEEQDYL